MLALDGGADEALALGGAVKQRVYQDEPPVPYASSARKVVMAFWNTGERMIV